MWVDHALLEDGTRTCAVVARRDSATRPPGRDPESWPEELAGGAHPRISEVVASSGGHGTELSLPTHLAQVLVELDQHVANAPDPRRLLCRRVRRWLLDVFYRVAKRTRQSLSLHRKVGLRSRSLLDQLVQPADLRAQLGDSVLFGQLGVVPHPSEQPLQLRNESARFGDARVRRAGRLRGGDVDVELRFGEQRGGRPTEVREKGRRQGLWPKKELGPALGVV